MNFLPTDRTGAPLRVLVLGSTGSIGTQTLQVAEMLGERVTVVGLGANTSARKVAEQASAFGVTELAMASEAAAATLATLVPSAHIAGGPAALVALIDRTEPDVVVNALVGAAGLDATVATLRAGKRLALANKESLVVGGDLVVPLLAKMAPAGAEMIPVDSEHSAIFQCLVGERRAEVNRLWLTASGGPFFGMARADLAQVTPERALAHPTWAMGPKITVDSSTLMNKGLEVIEAHHLFAAPYDQISVVVHRQSTVHSMVEFSDGSVKAHLGVTDMRIPIEYALTYPGRGPAPLPPLDLAAIGTLTFESADTDTFGCLRLAYEAGSAGGSAPVVLNAANEVAVAAFLDGRARYTDIENVVAACLDQHDAVALESFDHIHAIDTTAREAATREVARRALGTQGSW